MTVESDLGLPAPEAKRFVRRAAEVLAANFAARIVAGVAGVAVARALGPADRGVLAVVVVVVTATATAAVMGTDLWVLRHGTEPRSDSLVRSALDRHLRRALPAVLALGCMALVISGVLEISAGLIMAATAFALTTVVYMPFVLVPLARGRAWRYCGGLLLEAGAPLLAALIFLGGAEPSAALVLFVWSGGRLAGAWIGRSTLSPGRMRVDSEEYRALLRFGFPSALGVMLTVVMYRADALILGAIRGTEPVGLYVAAAALVELAYVLPDSISPVLVGEISGDDEGARSAAAVRAVTGVIALGGVVLVAAGPWVMGVIYGGEYRAGWIALPPLAVAALALSVWKLLVADLAARDETRVRVTSGLLAVAVMVLSTIVLTPSLGIAGAGLGSMFGYGSAAAVATACWLRRTGSSPRVLVGLRQGDVSALVRALHPLT